ncbi:30S ribosomal protein S6 [Candidatus Daviesbacteria bacterium]|nr:30S ribosomal protein S6 [Candidatus Daviesbacteria bacterium]
MQNYYLTLVLKPDLEDKDKDRILDAVKKRVVGEEGKVSKEDKWGSRDLVYPIKKNSKGFYMHYEIETEPARVKGLDKFLQLEEDILRYLLVRV